jgi:rod shape-determining protein MreD
VIRRLRLAFVVLGVVVLQTTLFTHLRVFDVAPDVGLVAVLAVAYDHGPETGALFGFVMGLVMDMFLTTPAGLSALAWGLTGYAVGAVQSAMIRSTPRAAPVVGGIGGLVGGLVFVTVGAAVGEPGFLSVHGVKIVVVAAVLDALVAPLVFPLARAAAASTPPAVGAWRVGRR